MKRLKSILYTLATVLIVVGALFILQAETYGLMVLSLGLGLNIIYRLISLNTLNLNRFNILECLKFLAILIMVLSCILIFTEFSQKYNLLILSIVFDFIVNYKELKATHK